MAVYLHFVFFTCCTFYYEHESELWFWFSCFPLTHPVVTFISLFIFSLSRIVYKEFLSKFVKVASVPVLATVPEVVDNTSSSPGPVPRLALGGVILPPLEKDVDILALLREQNEF